MRRFAFNQCEQSHNDALRCKFSAFFSAESQRLLACMSSSSSNIMSSSSLSESAAEPETGACAEQTRRTLLLGAFATTAWLGCSAQARADEDPPGSDERPKKGDLLVFSEGDQEGKVIS